MKNYLLVILIGIGFTASAQEVYTSSGRSENAIKKAQKKKDKGFDKSKIIWGGGLSLSVGTITNVGVSPVVGYRISDHLSAGISAGFQYVRIKDYWEVPNFNTNPVQYEYHPYKATVFSGGVWARYVIWKNIFAHAEYEHNFMSFKVYDVDFLNNNEIYSYNENYNAPSILLGAGYRQPVTENASFLITALYDVLQDKYSPYGNQVFFRFALNIGF